MKNTLYKNIKSIILDMDGVLWKDSQPIGNLSEIFKSIETIGLNISFATNNATRSIDQHINKLSGFGIKAKPDQVINSSLAVANYLLVHYPKGGGVYIIGEEGLHQFLEEFGFFHSEVDPKVVIAAMDRQLTYEKLKHATLLIRAGVPFIGTNPDRTFPTPEGLVPGAGAILAALETASGTKPLILGKPSPEMYKIAIMRMGVHPDECLVVGDRLETDIAGGQSAGCLTALVLSGVTSITEAEAWSPAPDIIAHDLGSLVKQLRSQRF